MVKVNKIYNLNCLEGLKILEDESIDMQITSPPYWALRDYGIDGQLGHEKTFQEYINKLCDIFDEVKRVLKKDGTCWVNIGDCYGSGKGDIYGDVAFKGRKILDRKEERPSRKGVEGMDKNLLMIPFRFAIEMQNRGWILRNVIIWHKPNAMPSSVKDRFTVDFEYLFFFVKSKKYYFQTQYEKSIWAEKDKRSKIKGGKSSKGKSQSGEYGINRVSYSENGQRNKRTVWSICTRGSSEAHYAMYPPELIETPIKAGCKENGIVMDVFMGSGTTALTSLKLGRRFVGFEINPKYVKIAEDRIKKVNIQSKLNSTELAIPPKPKVLGILPNFI